MSPRLDHAAFGNGRVLGLVSPTTAIEWLCMPRFDSPSIFARILDADRGGTFRFLGGETEIRGELGYLANTNVVRALFADGDAAWEVLDFAPRIPDGADVLVPMEIVRLYDRCVAILVSALTSTLDPTTRGKPQHSMKRRLGLRSTVPRVLST